MMHPPCKLILAKVTARDGRVYYRHLCQICCEWSGGEKDLSKMPEQELRRAYETTEAKIYAAKVKYLAEQAHVIYSKAWYEEKGVTAR